MRGCEEKCLTVEGGLGKESWGTQCLYGVKSKGVKKEWKSQLCYLKMDE